MLYGQIKNKLKIETVKALTIVKTHYKNFSCSEFISQNIERKSVSGTGSQI
jgi:hypothetical protein